MLLVEATEDLLKIVQNLNITGTILQIINARHDVNRLGPSLGEVMQATDHLTGGLTGNTLVEPEAIAGQGFCR